MRGVRNRNLPGMFGSISNSLSFPSSAVDSRLSKGINGSLNRILIWARVSAVSVGLICSIQSGSCGVTRGATSGKGWLNCEKLADFCFWMFPQADMPQNRNIPTRNHDQNLLKILDIGLSQSKICE